MPTTTQVTLHIPNDLHEWLSEYAASQHITRSAALIGFIDSARRRRLSDNDRVQQLASMQQGTNVANARR